MKLSQRSIFAPFLFFWFFSSFPRIWYFVQNETLEGGWRLAGKTLAIGFFQDGLLAAGVIILLRILQPVLRRLPQAVLLGLQYTEITLITALLTLMIASIEFFRLFGANANITHMAFITDSEILLPSLRSIFLVPKTLAALVGVPALFVIVNLRVRGWKIDLFMKSRAGLVVMILMVALGVGSRMVVHEKDPLRHNLSDNYLLSFLHYAILGDHIEGATNQSLASLLDPLPLPHATRKEPKWFFIDEKYPLAKATAHHLCRMGRWSGKACNEDADGDGFPVMKDCNDLEALIHPGAVEVPGNSVDEDCSGADGNPPNFIFIHWEGARAVNVGSIGYFQPSTPRFDKLAEKGRLYKNTYANGTQTRWSVTSIYNSILPRLSNRWIFKHNPELNMMAFPLVLKNVGYHTAYIHGGDINFGSFKTRYWEWFETMFDRNTEPLKSMPRLGWGLRDRDLFNFSYKFLKERKDPRPFYLTIATLSLHHPFHLPERKFEFDDHDKQRNKVPNILRYSDDAVGEFIEKIMADPVLGPNTAIIVAADHGLNWYAPHKTSAQSTLWEDLVWVPMLLIGNGWNLQPGVDTEVRQLADIGPTILDRLDVQVPNHFIGHSLLRSFGGRQARAYFGNANGGLAAGIRMGTYKYFVSYTTKHSRLFDVETDRAERRELSTQPEFADMAKTYHQMVTSTYAQHNRLIQDNRIWNWDFSLKKDK